MGIIHHDGTAVCEDDFIDDRWQRCDQLKIKFAFKPFLYDLHMQHAEKAASEPETERNGAFRLIRKGSVVQLELVERIAQIRVFGAIFRIYAAVNHRSCRAIPGQSLRSGVKRVCNRVADAGILDVFDARRKVADIARPKLVARIQAHRPHVPDLDHLAPCARGHKQHFAVFAYAAVHYPHEDNDASVVVVLTVEYKRLQRSVRIAGRGGNVLDDVVQNRIDVYSRLCAYFRRILRGNADNLLYLVLNALRIGGGKVYLVHNGDNLKVVVEREICVG